MKKLMKFLIRILAASTIASKIALVYFAPKTWSYFFGQMALFLITYEILRFAFETKVADLHFQGKKVGEMRDEE